MNSYQEAKKFAENYGATIYHAITITNNQGRKGYDATAFIMKDNTDGSMVIYEMRKYGKTYVAFPYCAKDAQKLIPIRYQLTCCALDALAKVVIKMAEHITTK